MNMRRLIFPLTLWLVAFALPALATDDNPVRHIVAFAQNGTGCSDGRVSFFFSYDGYAHEWVDVGLYDADGQMLALGSYAPESDQVMPQLGTFDLRFDALGNTPATRPFFLSFRPGIENSTATSFELASEWVRYPFDPVALGATRCDTLPYTPLRIGFEDGRLNWRDNGQTVAIYCERDGSITLLALSQTTGRALYALRASLRDIARASIPRDEAVIIRQDNRDALRLYRLTTGEFQVNAPYTDAVEGELPNGYVYIWDGCAMPNIGKTRTIAP